MSKYKILIKISGSIAAYKTASLISKLVQNNCEVKTVVTKDSLNFIGKATLEGLTGNKVLDDMYENGSMMSHINLVKWADATILVPATANTINKFANGIADNLVTSLFLAHDWTKPYIVVPAMNTNMFEHPSTKESIAKLKNWGIDVLPTQEGYLACGDIGFGKMLEPENIFEFIINKLREEKEGNISKHILITAGGTKEYIDGVRYLTNLSTGTTASIIAQYYIDNNFKVTYLHSSEAKLPTGDFESLLFTNFDSLHNIIKSLVSKISYDLIIHNAAVSDYTVKEIIVDKNNFEVPLKHKLESTNNEILLKLTPNFKIVNNIKNYSMNNSTKLVSFKFTNTNDNDEINSKVTSLLKDSNSDLVVQNDLSTRENNLQSDFNFYDMKGFIKSEKDANNIGKTISDILNI
jgi:phosphopantothenoylcysteine decarboxylase / phosphopantothenate---cysteine ligase